MNARLKIMALSDRAVGVLIAALVLGSTVAFGGGVWWFRPFLAAAAFLLVAIKLIPYLLSGRIPFLKSPLTILGLMAMALGVVQLLPLPTGLASRLSPTAHEVYGRGVLPAMAAADDPQATLPEAPQIRSPATLDRAATLRWLVGAAACLGIFWTVSHFTDRLGRLYLVWSLVVAGFLLNTAMGIVQITNRSDGLFGLYVPGSGPAWTPTLDDLFETPTRIELRTTADLPAIGSLNAAAPAAARAVLEPTTPFLFGTMMASSGAFLAMGTMALPLAMAIVVHMLMPRGSRESLGDRLGQSGHGSLVLLLVAMMLLGAFLVGLIGGPWYSLPVVLGLAIVGLPALACPGARGVGFALTFFLLASLGLGAMFQTRWTVLLGGPPPVHSPDLALARSLWSDSMAVMREFPVVGSGLGSFATIHPYFKDRDLSSTTAMSSLFQWGAETGVAGLAILAAGLLWCLVRIPFSLKQVGQMDRTLAHGLIGAALSFTLLAAVHWTIELSAVAISASALGGTWNRWLAGGTDLFVERG